MAQSNRHWPSMFKSKPCSTHHQWQHDLHSPLLSKNPYSSAGEERSPEPKPRWNPRPEQIRILETIFNSGMVNPPRDEIRRIRTQLQEYGQVGDANVFYWFQNRKSRSKHKNRQGKSAAALTQAAAPQPAAAAAPSSSSSSSEKSSPGEDKTLALGAAPVLDVSNSPTASVNQKFFTSAPADFPPEPFLFPSAPSLSHGYLPCEFPVAESGMGLLQALMNPDVNKNEVEERMKMVQMQVQHHGFVAASAPPPCSAIDEIPGPPRSTVFINDMAFEVAAAPLNVRETFGGDAVLLHSSGTPVLTNEWGVTLHALQNGAFYYLV